MYEAARTSAGWQVLVVEYDVACTAAAAIFLQGCWVYKLVEQHE
jgi:hypothetical protein